MDKFAKQGKVFDLAAFCQYFAFDTLELPLLVLSCRSQVLGIGEVSFGSKHGLMSAEEDKDNVLESVKSRNNGIIMRGQVPSLNAIYVNPRVQKVIGYLGIDERLKASAKISHVSNC